VSVAVLKQRKPLDGIGYRVYLPDSIGGMGETIHGERMGRNLSMAYAKALGALIARHTRADISPTELKAAIRTDPDGILLESELREMAQEAV
jgi:hypothetical protein